MLAQRESRKCILVVKVRAAADYDRGNAFDSKQFPRGSAGERDSKIMSNPCLPLRVVILNCDQFGTEDGRGAQGCGRMLPTIPPQ